MIDDPTLLAAIDEAIADARADGGVPGLAVAATDGEGVIAHREAGDADPVAGRAVAPTTRFEIGSIGKAFTAAVILQLADEGRLAVDDPVVRHLPWFKVPRTGDRITLHHLLSHTAGITAGTDGTPESTFQVWRLRDLPPGSAPGRHFHYSNVGYKALGLVIEAIEGAPYGEVIRRRLLEPIGMRDSEPTITDDTRARLAVPYQPLFSERPWDDGDPIAPAPWLTTDTADGSVAATAIDLAAFLRFLMIDPSGVSARMQTLVTDTDHGGYRWGYGYALSRLLLGGRSWVGHGGGMVGYLAGMQWEPASGIGATVLQSGMSGQPMALARRVARQVAAWREGRDPRGEGPEVWQSGRAHPARSGRPIAIHPVPASERAVIAGTYRSHSPWTPVLRIEDRAEELWLVFDLGGPDGFDDEQVLVPMARGWFRAGRDRLGPERLRFDTVIDGLARRAWLSGWDYYRVRPDPGPDAPAGAAS
jgi:CubicO group peptidase (beta-lactamase class C family)